MEHHGLLWALGLEFEKQATLFSNPLHPASRSNATSSKASQNKACSCYVEVGQSHSSTAPVCTVQLCQSQQVRLLLVPQRKKVPWNKGPKMSKSDMQDFFIPLQDYELFLAVALYFAGPKYVMAFWLTMVTSRRISETLRLHGEDVFLEGGPHHDSARKGLRKSNILELAN